MGSLFSTKQKQSSETQSTQQGTSQANIFETPEFQEALAGFYQQFSPGNITAAGTPSPYQVQAAGNQAGVASEALTPAVGATGSIATEGISTADILKFMSPYTEAVVNPTLAAQEIQNKQAISTMRGNQGVRGALGNETGAEAAYFAGVQPAQQAQISQLYNLGWSQALDAAAKSKGLQTQAAGQLGSLAGAATGANLGLASIGKDIYTTGLMPFNLTTQMAQGLTPFIGASGMTTSAEAQGSGKSTTTSSPGLGLIGANLLGAWLMSDARLKHNIRVVGATFDGQPIYAYNFDGGPTQIGLLAQEVARDRPEAVGVVDDAGHLGVDYDVATAPAAAMAAFEPYGGGEATDLERGEDGVFRPMADGGPALGVGPAATRGPAVGGGMGSAPKDGDDFTDKVVKAFHAFRAMRREGGAVGGAGRREAGVRPRYDVGGVAGPSGIDPAGWAPVVTPEPAGPQKPTWQISLGRGLMDLGKTAGADIPRDDAVGRALQSQQAGLASLTQSLMAQGRQGFDEGGVVAPSFYDLWSGIEGLGPAAEPAGAGAPMSASVGKVPADFPYLLPYSPLAQGSHGVLDPYEGFDAGAPASAPAAARAAGALGASDEGTGYPLLPGTVLEPLGAPTGVPGTAMVPWAPTVRPEPVGGGTSAPAAPGVDPDAIVRGAEAAAAARPAPDWRESLGPFGALIPRYDQGIFAGEAPTWQQRLGMALLSVGPLAGVGQSLLAQYQERTKERAAEAQARHLEQQIAHQQAALEETRRAHDLQATPDIVRSLEAAGFQRGTPEFQRMLEKILTKDRTESAATIELAKAGVKEIQERTQAIAASQQQLSTIGEMERLVANPNVAQGALADWKLTGKRLANALFPGAGFENVEEGEALRALSNRITLTLRQTGDGAGMPGAMSDADRVFLQQAAPGLTTTREGNQLLLRIMRETEQYRIAANAEAINYLRQNPTNYAGLAQHMTQWMAVNPMSRVVPEHAATRAAAEDLIAPQREPVRSVGKGSVQEIVPSPAPAGQTAPQPGAASAPRMPSAAAQPVGARRVVNGITYEKREDGRWYPVESVAAPPASTGEAFSPGMVSP